MSLSTGDRLGPYQVLAKLGEGGMGEVYRARDSKLNRDVALKVLSGRVAGDSGSLARFEREARVLASLNHANIAQVYGFEQRTGESALVMELVEGPTLADRLSAGALRFDDAVAIAKQIAAALDAAHEQGIVHRDLKPANVKVRDDGTVKVLDFGLAKVLDPQESGSDAATMTAHMTQPGMILGTAAYMSPEQARGQRVDKRADIWAFGCVLYEMLSGRRPFTGASTTDVLAAVLNVEPDLTRIPERARRLVALCLEKDPRRRLRDIGDALTLVDAAVAAPAGAAGSRVPWLVWAGLAASTAIAITLAVLHFGERPIAPPPMRFDVPLPEGTVNFTFEASPDGRYVAVAVQRVGGSGRLLLRTIATGEERELPGTERAQHASWSPDSRNLMFVAEGQLKTVSVSGGAPRVLAKGLSGRGCWGISSFIVMNNAAGISAVPLDGGEPVVVTVPDHGREEIHHEQPACLPDGRFLYFRHMAAVGTSGIFLGDPRLPPGQQSATPLFAAVDGPVLVPGTEPGRRRLLFMTGERLMWQWFDVGRAALIGEPAAIAEGVFSTQGSGMFSASQTGLLLYRAAANVPRQLTWVDRGGSLGGTVGAGDWFVRGLRLSKDGTRAAVQMFPPGGSANNDDIWIVPFSDEPPRRLTSNPAPEQFPVWSPDDSQIAFASNVTGAWQIYRQSVDGGAPGLVAPATGQAAPALTQWSPDGRFLLMTANAPKTRADIWAMPVSGAGDRKAIPIVQTPFAESAATLSPDGRWLAYLSDETGRLEVYLRRFEVSPDGVPSSPEAGKRLISTGARGLVRWRGDGKELLYMTLEGTVVAVPVTTAPALSLGAPVTLFQFPDRYLRAAAPGAGMADMTPDGRRFLVYMPTAPVPRPTLHAIVNWR